VERWWEKEERMVNEWRIDVFDGCAGNQGGISRRLVGPGQPGNLVSLENQEYLVNLENLVSLGNQDNRLYQKFCN